MTKGNLIKIGLGIIYLVLAYSAIIKTSYTEALSNDAQSYYDTAISIVNNNNVLSTIASFTPQFSDRGYPVVLSLIVSITGSNNITFLQIANYVFWIISTLIIYLSLKFLKSKRAELTTVIMLFSPLYLTFSTKLYSESFASLGLSLLIYGFVVSSGVPLLIGSIILGSTKSIFIPGIIILLLYFIFYRCYKKATYLFLGLIILIPSILSSFGGSRSLYNLAVERAKLDQSYDQVLACAPYYLSYPLGQKVLPQYEGVCHQNDPIPAMTGYEDNPYVRAGSIREGGFTYAKWLSAIFNHPVKFTLTYLVGLFNLILFEGVYPSILLTMSPLLIGITFIVTRLLVSIYLWAKIYQASKNNWTLFLPILYLAIVIGNFQVEPRYIYPLIPYFYFLSGLTSWKLTPRTNID